MNNFIYDIPVRVYFGKGQIEHLGEELKKYGERVLLVYGGGSIKKNGLYGAVASEIKDAGLELSELSGVDPNPKIHSIREGQKLCKEKKIDMVLAVGGGSVIDCAKVVAAAACVDFDPWDFLGKGVPIEKALPVISVLTIAATGSEMDNCAVISNPDTEDKIAISSSHMVPRASFLDPTYTYTVNRYQTACGAADILSHVFEIYFAKERSLYMVECFMEGLMKTVIRYAPVALREPDNYEARANLMWASSWAINGFIEYGKNVTWICHPLEHELSALYDITHGLGLAILTPRWMEYCLDETTAERFRQFGVNVLGIEKDLAPMEAAKKSIEMLSDFLFHTLGLSRTLTEIGIDDRNIKAMAEKICSGRTLPMESLKPLMQEDIEAIYRMCL